jgi:hypothetical protein
VNGQVSFSIAASILRTNNPLTEAVLDGAVVDLDDIVCLNEAMSPIYDASLSLGSPTEEVFTAQGDSTTTKPTSIGSPFPNNAYKGKGKGKAEAFYASSLSVAYGSGSEAEAQRHEVRKDALIAVGGWASGSFVPDEPLRGAARAKTRRHRSKRMKYKKPVIETIQHMDAPKFLHDEYQESTITIAATHDGPGTLTC